MSELQTYQDQLTGLEQGALPTVIQDAGDRARYKSVEFFFSTLANANTREAEELLAPLRRRGSYADTSAKVDIFLLKGRLEDAIASVSNESSYNAEPIYRVMDAVNGTHSDWVIENAQRRAASIMEEGKAKYYHHAVDWPKKAQAAYLNAGREAQWQRQLADISEKHGRKYKLMGLLKDL